MTTCKRPINCLPKLLHVSLVTLSPLENGGIAGPSDIYSLYIYGGRVIIQAVHFLGLPRGAFFKFDMGKVLKKFVGGGWWDSNPRPQNKNPWSADDAIFYQDKLMFLYASTRLGELFIFKGGINPFDHLQKVDVLPTQTKP